VRLVEFLDAERQAKVGLVVDDQIIDLTQRHPEQAPSLKQLLRIADWRQLVAQHHGEPADAAIADVELLPLLADTGRVFAAGLNYKKIYPAGKQPPTPRVPPWFSKMPGTLVGHGSPIVAPSISVTFDYEAELAAVIGTGGRHIAVDTALRHVAGWTCLNDGSVREWQRHSVSAGKNFDRSGSIGPWMVTADEIEDPQDLRLMARVDGEVRQDASTAEMIFSVAEIISYLSQSIELRPGDVIATGSPEGTGGSFDPPQFLVAGQTLEIEVEGIGVLRNHVIAEEPALDGQPQ